MIYNIRATSLYKCAYCHAWHVVLPDLVHFIGIQLCSGSQVKEYFSTLHGMYEIGATALNPSFLRYFILSSPLSISLSMYYSLIFDIFSLTSSCSVTK